MRTKVPVSICFLTPETIEALMTTNPWKRPQAEQRKTTQNSTHQWRRTIRVRWPKSTLLRNVIRPISQNQRHKNTNRWRYKNWCIGDRYIHRYKYRRIFYWKKKMKMMLKQKNTRNRKNTGFSRAVGEQVKSQSMEPVRESESVEQLKKKN